MQVRLVHNVELYHLDGTKNTTTAKSAAHACVEDVNWIEDVNAAGEKRSAEEAGIDAAPESSQTVGRGNLRVPRLVRKEPAGSPKTAAQGKRNRRQIQGMSEMMPFDAAQALRNTTVTLSWIELADIAPQIRVQLGKAMRLAKDSDKLKQT